MIVLSNSCIDSAADDDDDERDEDDDDVDDANAAAGGSAASSSRISSHGGACKALSAACGASSGELKALRCGGACDLKCCSGGGWSRSGRWRSSFDPFTFLS